MSKGIRNSRPSGPPDSIAAGQFKTHCLRLMDEVAEQRSELLITKYGRPVAKLVPVDEEVPDSFGALSGSITYLGEDLVSPDHGAWGESAP